MSEYCSPKIGKSFINHCTGDLVASMLINIILGQTICQYVQYRLLLVDDGQLPP